ncbi:MAG: helix-turn-helix domain-containing protein [Bacilli bacterium]
MSKENRIRAMQEYIENHIDEKITLSDLAKVSFYSPWYSYRLFVEVLGLTPSDYIRRLKLSMSANELKENKTKIVDIAYKYGYGSVDGYQRAFHKEFGINPYEYSLNPKPIYLFIPYKKYEEKEKKIMDHVSNVFVSIVEFEERRVPIKRGVKAQDYFSYCHEVGCDVWGLFNSIKEKDKEPLCLFLPQKLIKTNTSSYVQGVEVPSSFKDIPDGYEIITLPKATYLKFNGEPFEEEDYEQAITNLWQAMEKFDVSSIGYVYDEDNPRIQLEPIGKRGYIEFKAVKKK